MFWTCIFFKAYITHSLVNALADNHKFKHTRDGEEGDVEPLRDEGGTGSVSTPSSPRKDDKQEAGSDVTKVVEDGSIITKASSFSKQIEVPIHLLSKKILYIISSYFIFWVIS